MRIKIHQYEYFDRCSTDCRKHEVINTESMDVQIIPNKSEFIQMGYVTYIVDSVLHSYDTKEVIVNVRPIKRPETKK